MNCLHDHKWNTIGRQFAFCSICVLFFFSCKSNSTDNKGVNPIARVGDVYLDGSDITDLVPKGTSAPDSVAIVKKYIDNWVHETLVLQKAEKNLTDDQKNVKKQLDDYRRSLITYAYEQALIAQNLDTNVSEAVVEAYYQEHPSDFELKDNIIEVTYVKVKRNAPKIDKLKQWYRSDNEKDISALRNYCLEFAENYYIDNNNWLLLYHLLISFFR